jgi:hypothetical protein
VVPGLRHGGNKILALLGCYAAYIGNSLTTFRKTPFVPSSTVKQSKERRLVVADFSGKYIFPKLKGQAEKKKFLDFFTL